MSQLFEFNIYAIPVLVVSVLTPLTGLYIFVQNRKSSANQSFFLLCMAILLWLLGQAGVYSATEHDLALTIYRRVAFLGVVLISPTVYLFSTLWLGLYKEKKLFVMSGFLMAALFYTLGLFSSKSFPGMTTYYWGFYPVYGIYNQIFLGFFFTYFFAAFYNFIKAYKSEKEPIRIAQIKLISVAFLVSFLSSFDYVPKLFNFSFYPLGCLYVFTWIVIVAYAIIKYKAMDIETVVHRTLLWLGSSLIAAAPFAFLIHYLREPIAALRPIAQTAIWVVLTFGFYLYFRVLHPALNHFFRKKRANFAQVLHSFSDELSHLESFRDLLKRSVRMLRRTVYSKEVSVYLLDEEGKRFVPAHVKGIRGSKPYDAEHPFLLWLKGYDKLALRAYVEGAPELKTIKGEIKNYLDETHAQVIMPLVLGEKLIAIVHLGKKENLKRYSPAEIDFITQVRSPMTIAFSNSLQFENVSRLYNQVQDQNQRLMELDRLKSEFLANTSHELRTPLNGILGLVESILDGADGDVNDAQRKHLGMIIESGTSLKELINNLLELSRFESGQEQLDVKPFNIVNAVDAVIALTKNLAQKKGVRVSEVVSGNIHDVYGDPQKIQRVIMNLVGNAIKFTDEGSVTISVKAEGERVVVSVKDTGPGIAPEEQSKIFERFSQADGSSTRKHEGTGLGLSIAREIIKQHGSDISLRSEVGQGSEFYFSLGVHSLSQEAPAAEVSVEMAEPKKEGVAPVEPVGVATDPSEEQPDEDLEDLVEGEGETVLIIDDNAVNREVVKTRLELNNYRVIEAVDGVDGFKKVKEEKPDLIILDLMMPRMSGYEFCKVLREKHGANEIPVIMLTAKTDMGDKVYGLSLGANDYISKPFNKEELVARTSVLLKIRKMTAELKKWNVELEGRVQERTKELIDTQEQLIQAEKLATVGTMAGGVAHEINNPLTAVLTNSQILRMTANPQDMETIMLIEQGAKRCQAIVKNLMKYSRKPEYADRTVTCDCVNAISNAISLLRFQLKQENVHIDFNPPLDRLFINCNSNELEQVVTNLIVNAKDAVKNREGDRNIRVEVKPAESSVQILVIDNGYGVPSDMVGKLFDPFFTTKDIGEGTGLGLSVAFGIIEKYDGEIKLMSSRPGETIFGIRLNRHIQKSFLENEKNISH